jgi:hypothetical protein
MPIGSTISGQVGMSIETTAGDRIAPATWKQILDESLSSGRTMIESRAIGGGTRIPLASVVGTQQPGGDMTMELAAENAANLLRLAIGTPVTTGAGPYVHTYSPSVTAPLPSATIQKGVPDTAASPTVRPFDFVGSRANTWELTVAPNEIVKMKYGILAEYVDTAQTLATPTWPTLTLFSGSANVTVSVLGSSECVDNLTLTGANNLTASNPICATNPGRIQFQEDNTPVMAGPGEIVKQNMPFKFVRESTDATAFTAVLTTTTATAA